MSFWSVLKKIGTTALGIEHTVAPVASIVFPQFAPIIGQIDGWATRLNNAIVTVEANNPLDGQGQVKSAAVIADFEAGMDMTNAVLAARGKMLSYDQGELQNAINSFVAGYNSLAKVKQSFKEVDIPKAAAAAQ